MSNNIKVSGPCVALGDVYKIPFGKQGVVSATREELAERYAQTVVECLHVATTKGGAYWPNSAAERIMMAVTLLLDPDLVFSRQDSICSYLDAGFDLAGYKLIPDDGIERRSVLPEFPPLIAGSTIEFFGDEYQDCMTHEVIRNSGLCRYLRLLALALEGSEFLCDKAAFHLIATVESLIAPVDYLLQYQDAIERHLWEAARELGYRLDMADWYTQKRLLS